MSHSDAPSIVREVYNKMLSKVNIEINIIINLNLERFSHLTPNCGVLVLFTAGLLFWPSLVVIANAAALHLSDVWAQRSSKLAW